MSKHSNEEIVRNKRSKTNRKSRTRHINKFGIFVLVIILFAAIVAGYFAPKISNTIDKLGGGKQGILAALLGHDEQTLKNLDRINIVIIGESGVDETKQSDTLMIASYDPKLQKASLMSIPRDTYVGPSISNASAIYKINSRYVSGEKMDTLFSDLKNITGLDLNYYVRIDTKALIKLVDLIGGVDFEVPIDMDYDDPGQKLHIHLKKGMQKINGAKAEQLLRFRHCNNGATYPWEYGTEDMGRTRTQREFITATLSQTLKPENLSKINELVNIGYDCLKTNIDINQIIDYVPYAVNFNTANLRTEVLPGKPIKAPNGLWIYEYYKKDTKKMVQEMFLDGEVQDTDTTTKN